MTKYIQIFIFILTLSTSGQNATEMKIPENANEKFAEFISKKKFVKQPYPNFYPGIADEKMRPILTKKINQAANDFKTLSKLKIITDKKYQEIIGIGLSRFSDVYIDLDTEDRERVCLYFEELMDIVGLESSNGQLNKFMYGFDPNEQLKEKKYGDSKGNIFIEKGNEVFIVPANNENTGELFKIFIYNQTLSDIGLTKEFKIKPNEFRVFNLSDKDTLNFDNGVKFMLSKINRLEVEDKKSQVNRLGKKYLANYGVKNQIEWAFIIVPEGRGDK